jgi:hypothetical protein
MRRTANKGGEDMMIHKVDITPEMLVKANDRDHGAYNKMSFMNGAGNVVGFLGEYMFESICDGARHVDEYNHDFEWNGVTIDVKTKSQNVPHQPKGFYEATVTTESLQFQHPDYYVFCRIVKVDGEYKYGWVMGGISYNELMRVGRQVKKGDDEGNMVFKKDGINIRYDQLRAVGKNKKENA